MLTNLYRFQELQLSFLMWNTFFLSLVELVVTSSMSIFVSVSGGFTGSLIVAGYVFDFEGEEISNPKNLKNIYKMLAQRLGKSKFIKVTLAESY